MCPLKQLCASPHGGRGGKINGPGLGVLVGVLGVLVGVLRFLVGVDFIGMAYLMSLAFGMVYLLCLINYLVISS